MTITARQTSTRIHAARQLVDKLAALPLAVAEIHRAIDAGGPNVDDRPKAEDAGIRGVGHISDPTAQTALSRLTAYERHLDDVETHMRQLAASAGFLCDVVSRWVASAANREEHPRCTGGSVGGHAVEEWTDPTCSDYVSYRVRDDGTLSYRGDGLCDACRMRRHRWVNRQEVA